MPAAIAMPWQKVRKSSFAEMHVCLAQLDSNFLSWEVYSVHPFNCWRMDIERTFLNVTTNNLNDVSIGLFLYLMLMVYCYSVIITHPIIVICWLLNKDCQDINYKRLCTKFVLVSLVDIITLVPITSITNYLLIVINFTHPLILTSHLILKIISIIVSVSLLRNL